jgi:hypothetical protein
MLGFAAAATEKRFAVEVHTALRGIVEGKIFGLQLSHLTGRLEIAATPVALFLRIRARTRRQS